MAQGRIYTQVITVGDVEIYQVTGAPSGTLQARNGSLAIDNSSPPTMWQNIDGVTSWEVLTGPIAQFMYYTFATASPAVVLAVKAGSTIDAIQLDVSTAFDDAAATIEVGITAAPGAIMSSTQNDPTEVALYVTNLPYFVLADTNLILTLTPGTSTQGAGYIIAKIRQ